MIQTTLCATFSVGAYVVPPLLTVKWFPQNEWRLATGVGMYMPIVGGSVAYKLVPSIVPEPDRVRGNLDLIRHRVFDYAYGVTAICALSAILVLLYFPDEPPTPPTAAAELEEEHQTMGLMEALRLLARSPAFWACAFRCMLIAGPNAAISDLLMPFLRPLGVDQDFAGTVGMVTSLLGIPIALILGALADATKRHMKALVVASTLLTLQGAVWLVLINRGVLPAGHRSVFFASFLYFSIGGSTLGLIVEIACEAMYPIPEEYVASAVQQPMTIMSIAISSSFMVSSSHYTALNYIIMVCTIVGTVCAFILPERYNRMDAGKNKESEVEGRDNEAVSVEEDRSDNEVVVPSDADAGAVVVG